jgi:branched-chain amino acid transport system substrate-binding protein
MRTVLINAYCVTRAPFYRAITASGPSGCRKSADRSIHGLGLETARGLVFTESFYWDMNEATRGWSKRFFARAGRMPGMVQAGTYSSVMHAEVKAPSESTAPWDYYKIRRIIPAEEAAQPLAQSKCALVKL